MGKILSVSDCQDVLDEINKVSALYSEQCQSMEEAIDLFNNNPIVQSFYASGKYGESSKELINKTYDVLKKYYAMLEEDEYAIVPQTRKFIEDYKNELIKNASAESSRYTNEFTRRTETEM